MILGWIEIMIPFHRSNRMTGSFTLAQVNLYRALLLLIMAYGYAGQRMTMTGGQIWSGMTVGAMIVFFLEWELIPHAILQPGIQIDNRANHLDAQADTYSLLLRDRAHTETVVLYAPVAKMGKFPYDGTVITASLLAMQNTSRGKITIASADATDHPLIDPNFYTTKTDRVVIRHGIRRILRLMQETSGEKDMVPSLVPEEVQAPPTTSSTDEDIDEHVKSSGHSWNHPAGTAAMETAINKGVVDSKCRVHGVAGLRAVDASVLPVPIAAHCMVCVYALGWKVADLIADSLQ
jgi:choline dehydrogenase-like flavoprotein